MSDDESYWLQFLLKSVIFMLFVAFMFVLGLIVGGAVLISVFGR